MSKRCQATPKGIKKARKLLILTTRFDREHNCISKLVPTFAPQTLHLAILGEQLLGRQSALAWQRLSFVLHIPLVAVFM